MPPAFLWTQGIRIGKGNMASIASSSKGSNQKIAVKLGIAAAAAAAFILPAVAAAQSAPADLAPPVLSLAPVVHSAPDVPQAAPAASDAPGLMTAADKPVYLDAGAEQPNIHGFFNSPFKTGYVTPRGLVVQDKGVVWQPIVGLVIPIGDFGPVKDVAVVGGIWNSVNSYVSGSSNPTTGGWDEMDVFVSFGGKIMDSISVSMTYEAWNSPEHHFSTEHSMHFKASYADKFLGDSGFSINPYVEFWWAVSGDSTVILGRKGSTYYFEPGIVPAYTLKAVPDYPITITMPIYFSVGPANYWDAHKTLTDSNFGLISASLNFSVPLSFIPARYGHWHADAGVTYDYLINSSLLAAGGLASGNDSRNVVIGSVGFGLNF